MPLPNTIQEKFAGATFPGATREVLAKDASRLTTMYDDFIFDAMDPNCYAAGVLPTVSGGVPIAGMVNLANNVAPALGRSASAVTLEPTDATRLPVFTGKGWWSNNFATAGAMLVKKGGVSNVNVARPVSEGWVDNVLIVYAKFDAGNFGNGGIVIAGAGANSQYGGIKFNNSTTIVDVPSNGTIGNSTTGVWYQLAVHYAFSADHSTVAIRRFLNGVLVSTTPAQVTAGTMDGNGGTGLWVGNWPAGGGMYGEVGRVRRLLNVGKGASNAEIDALIAAEHAWKMPLLLAA